MAGFFVGLKTYFFGIGALLAQVQLGSRWQVPSPIAALTLPGLQTAAVPTGQLSSSWRSRPRWAWHNWH